METGSIITDQDLAKMEKLDAWLHLQAVEHNSTCTAHNHTICVEDQDEIA